MTSTFTGCYILTEAVALRVILTSEEIMVQNVLTFLLILARSMSGNTQNTDMIRFLSSTVHI